MTVPADPRAAAEQAIAEALRRERMALDDYAPMPEAPEPLNENPAPTQAAVEPMEDES